MITAPFTGVLPQWLKLEGFEFSAKVEALEGRQIVVLARSLDGEYRAEGCCAVGPDVVESVAVEIAATLALEPAKRWAAARAERAGR